MVLLRSPPTRFSLITLVNVPTINTKPALKCVDRLIHTYLLDLLDQEMEYLSTIEDGVDAKKYQFFGEHKDEFPSLMDTVVTLQNAEKVTRKYRLDRGNDTNDRPDTYTIGTSMHKRNYSTPVGFLSGEKFLSIDEPIEDDGSGDGWYFGGDRPSSPPPIQSVEYDRNATNKSVYTSNTNSFRSHRRTMSTGATGLPSSPARHTGSNGFSPTRSSNDSNLFRLIVTLQLCFVRIEEANSVLCRGKAGLQSGDPIATSGRYRSDSIQDDLRFCSANKIDSDFAVSTVVVAESDRSIGRLRLLTFAFLGIGATFYMTTTSKTKDERIQLAKSAGKMTLGVATASLVRKRWRILTMNARLANSGDAIEDWIMQWICLIHGNNGSEERQLHARRKVRVVHKVSLHNSQELMFATPF